MGPVPVQPNLCGSSRTLVKESCVAHRHCSICMYLSPTRLWYSHRRSASNIPWIIALYWGASRQLFRLIYTSLWLSSPAAEPNFPENQRGMFSLLKDIVVIKVFELNCAFTFSPFALTPPFCSSGKSTRKQQQCVGLSRQKIKKLLRIYK